MGGGATLGAERKIVQSVVFGGKRHDNIILKVRILLSRNFVVIVQAPRNTGMSHAQYFERVYPVSGEPNRP